MKEKSFTQVCKIKIMEERERRLSQALIIKQEEIKRLKEILKELYDPEYYHKEVSK